MAWFGGRVSLGNFPDLAGAVNKISESVKNIEKNFDSALGFEEKSDPSNEGMKLGCLHNCIARLSHFCQRDVEIVRLFT